MRLLTVTVLVALLAGCSSSDNGVPETLLQEDVTTTPAFLSRLWTPLSPDTVQGWACTTDSGIKRGYLLLAGEELPTAANQKLIGVELNPDATSASDNFSFYWSINSSTSALLDDPRTGRQVEWSNIKFSNNDFFSAFSSVLGEFKCSRETTSRGES